MCKRILYTILILGILNFAVACGGGGGGSSDTSDPDGGDTVADTTTLTGTVATGQALSGVMLYIKDSLGSVKHVTTEADGSYTLDVSDMTAPFYLEVEGYGLYSLYNSDTGVANVTPLTTLFVALANGGDADIYTSAPAVSSLKLDEAEQALIGMLAGVLTAYGVEADINFINDAFDADGSGVDAILDALTFSITGTTVTVTNTFNGTEIASATLEDDGSLAVAGDGISAADISGLATGVTNMRMGVILTDDYDSEPVFSFSSISIDASGMVVMRVYAVDGDTGDLYIETGTGTKSGSDITFTLSSILCSDEGGTGGTAVFTGTMDDDGNVSGTFENTITGGICQESGTAVYTGSFTAENVTDATPADIEGTYEVYATPEGAAALGPVEMEIDQTANLLTFSLTYADDTVEGSGVVYGNYIMMSVPAVICEDTCFNESCANPEMATFFGYYSNGTIEGYYGDGIVAGVTCQNGSATGYWTATKQ